MSYNVDDPKEKLEEDTLNRVKFAENIYKIIASTPLEENLRVGICGPWGSGKTTVLNFIKVFCEERKNPIAIFKPWQFKNRDEAWFGLISAIDKALTINKNKKFTGFKRRKVIRTVAEGARKIVEIADSKIAKLLGEVIISPLIGLLEEKKKEVEKELEKNLGINERLYILIDDLDRAEPEIVYDLLIILNEIVDFKKCVYIIGIDKQSTIEIIKNKLKIVKSEQFLDKIINYSFKLPEPQEKDWYKFIEYEFHYNRDINKTAFCEIYSILNKNPRYIKRFMKYLNSLEKFFLERFEQSELNHNFLYATQLLKYEFPELFLKFVNDQNIVEDLTYGYLKRLNDKKEKKYELYDKYISNIEDTKKERIKEIIDFVKNSTFFLNKEQCKSHLFLLENIEILTWKEFNKIFHNNNIILTLCEYIKNNKKEVVKEFLKKIVLYYSNIWSEIVSKFTQEEINEKINEISKVIDIFNDILKTDDFFNEKFKIFDIDIYKEWYKNLTAYINFTNRVYIKYRDQEKEILLRITEKLEYLYNDILEFFQRNYEPSIDERTNLKNELKDKIYKICIKKIIYNIIKLFEEKDGISKLYDERKYLTIKKIIFDSKSDFFKKNNLKKIYSIIKQAQNKIEIQYNFYCYLDLLVYNLEYKIIDANILTNKNFIKKIWKTVIINPLNRRFMGELKRIRDFFQQNNIVLNYPRWWKKYYF